MTFKKTIAGFHLWLGLSTGTVVFILGLTGAIYCFAPELQDLQPYRSVKEDNKPFLAPSQIQRIAENALPNKTLQRIYYDARDKAVMVLLSKKDAYNYSVFINPYDGTVLKVRNNDEDFLSLVLKIHRTLGFPFGHQIIRWSTVIFLLMLISGIILWCPQNRRTAKQGFKIMWRASPKRLNYDLHKVLGFYATWIVIFTALSGLMFAFEGFANFTYSITGANQSIVQKKPPLSDTTSIIDNNTAAIDVVWKVVQPHLHSKYVTAMFVLPSVKSGAILLRANSEKGTLYKTDFRYFDQYSGKEFSGAYVWGKYKDAHTTADYIRRMNYDIHTGAVLGLPGRVVLFFIVLIVTSLPITGFYFWWGKKLKIRKLNKGARRMPS